MFLVDQLAHQVCLAGSDHLPLFGGAFEGGYCVQQVPAELSRLVALLSALGPYRQSLDIGIAAGGTTRFIREYVQIDRTAIIDDGRHPRHDRWAANKRGIMELAEFIGDSHSAEAAAFLDSFRETFDLVGIDADHSLEGVRADWDLVQPHLAIGALVWFHDIVACVGVSEFWQDLKTDSHHAVLLETDALGIGVLRYLGNL